MEIIKHKKPSKCSLIFVLLLITMVVIFYETGNPMQEINIKSGYFEINCLIDSGNAEIFWAKNGQPFNPPAGRAIFFADNKKKIVFERVNEEDSGLYTCVANNEYLTSVSTDLFVESNLSNGIAHFF